MLISSTLLVFSFTAVYGTVFNKEIINGGSMKTSSNSCEHPEDFPLFSNSSCISPELYTALFLISIILASLTLLMLITFLFLLFRTRRLKRVHHDYEESIMPNHVNPENNYIKPVTSATKPEKEISNVLRKIVNQTTLHGLPQSHIHHSFPIPTLQESLLASSNSFGDSLSNTDRAIEGQTKSRNIIPTISESNESNTRQSSERSSISQNDNDNNQRQHSTRL